MWTLVGYRYYGTTGNILTYAPGLADQHVRVEGNNIVVPGGMGNLLGAFVLGVSLSRAQVESPALRRTLLLDLGPINTGGSPLYPAPIFDAFYNPIPLDEYEPLRFLVAGSEASNENKVGLIWLGDGPQAPVTGEIYTVRCAASATLSPYAWTNGALTIGQTLPAGRYQVVGMRAESANLIAARLVFVGGTWRPGCIGYNATYEVEPSVFRRGALGVWGEFAHDQPPTVDFLSSGADTSETVWLDLIKVA